MRSISVNPVELSAFSAGLFYTFLARPPFCLRRLSIIGCMQQCGMVRGAATLETRSIVAISTRIVYSCRQSLFYYTCEHLSRGVKQQLAIFMTASNSSVNGWKPR
jgi:hypothetical protein